MHPKSPKWLDDIVDAAAFILEITNGSSLNEYAADRRLRQLTERNFITIGEALRRIEQTDPATAHRMPRYRIAIDLRNRLVHGYNDIDYALVWEAVQESLPALLRAARILLDQAEREAEPWDEE